MEDIEISYRITLKPDVTEVFDFQLDGQTFALAKREVPDPPNWTKLEFNQCAHCPLKATEHTHCPMALQLHSVVSRFHKTRSIDEVDLEVITEERRVLQRVQLQRALSSMLGLIFPTCGCPKTEYMRPMARFHLPLATEEETVFRVAGMYLLAQYFLTHNGKKGQFAFDGLVKIYDDLHILNKAIAGRLQLATQSDSAKNAITLLDMYTTLVPMLLEDQLAEIRGFFGAYLPVEEMEAPASGNNYLEKAKAFSLELELEPVAGESQKRQSDLPDWLKEIKGIKDEPPAAQDDPFAGKLSGLSLALEPEVSAPPPPRGKAVFSLPDDEPPPAKPGAAAPVEKPVEKKPADEGGWKLMD